MLSWPLSTTGLGASDALLAAVDHGPGSIGCSSACDRSLAGEGPMLSRLRSIAPARGSALLALSSPELLKRTSELTRLTNRRRRHLHRSARGPLGLRHPRAQVV